MADQAPDIADLVAGLTKHAEALHAASSMEVPGEPAEADALVREMLSRAGDLVRGAAALGQQRNVASLGVLLRAILENLILLLWVQVDQQNAKALSESAHAELVRAARINLEKGRARVLDRETGEDATAEFLQSDKFKNLPKRQSIEARAKEAGVEDLYTVFYRFMSLDTHGHKRSETDEKSEQLAAIQLQGAGGLAMASGHSGARWLLHKERTDNETLRSLLRIGK